MRSISDSGCEPTGLLQVHGRKLRGVRVAGAEIANVIDELPIIAVAGALAEGKTEIRDAKELRVKETDRIEAMAHNLRAFGVEVEEHDDGMTVHGGAHLARGARQQPGRSPHGHGLRHSRHVLARRNGDRGHGLHRHLLPDVPGGSAAHRPVPRGRPGLAAERTAALNIAPSSNG